MSLTLHWHRDQVTPEVLAALRLLAEEYPLIEGPGGQQVRFEVGAPPGAVSVSRVGQDITVKYGSLTDALRGLGAALAGLVPGSRLTEHRPFSTFGAMVDCSRNAVMKVNHVKAWLRRLALLGFNMMQLYTEDTFQVPGEPLIGLFRGAYSREELAEIDAYAAALGVEMIGCMQSLGHFSQILKYPPYAGLAASGSTLRTDLPQTYHLVRKMVQVYAESFRSRRIHVCMDEADQIRSFDQMNEHVGRVAAICREFGLRPMIWSDMYFLLGSNQGKHYDPEAVFPHEAKAGMPADVQLVYWEYYPETEAPYLALVQRHRELGKEPLVASVVWTTHPCFWYGRDRTEATAGGCIRACRQAGVKEMFFTMWGDDGGECELDSALAGLAFAAAAAYGESQDSLEKRYRAICGIGYEQTCLGSRIEDTSLGGRIERNYDSFASLMLWDDPLLGMHWLNVEARRPGYWAAALEHFEDILAELRPHREVTGPVDLGHAWALARFILAKMNLRRALERACQARDCSALEAAASEAEDAARLAEELEITFRRQWLRRNKRAGLEVIQIRLGGMRQRLLETARVVRELARGERETIPELEDGLALSGEARAQLTAPIWVPYRGLATPSDVF